MSAFRNRGLTVSVDTTLQAEFDFASWQITDDDQEAIASNLQALPISPRDSYHGHLRVRELKGWDVGFTIAPDENGWVLLIMAIEKPGELEAHFDYLMRAAKTNLPAYARELLKGRGPKK